MENRYWIGRKRGAMTMARTAVSAEVRLIHYDLAGRYSVMAAQCAAISAAAPRATAGDRAVLHLRTPGLQPDAPLSASGTGRSYGQRS